MDVLVEAKLWTNLVLFLGMMALQIWALADCATRSAPAFPAANKLTKPAWLAITAFAALFALFMRDPINPISLVAVIAAMVYLTDVRPAVREISGGRY